MNSQHVLDIIVLNHSDFGLPVHSYRHIDLHYKEVNMVNLDLCNYPCLWIDQYAFKCKVLHDKITLVSGIYINVLCKISLEKKIQKKLEHTGRGQVRFTEGAGYKAASWQRLFQDQPEAAEP